MLRGFDHMIATVHDIEQAASDLASLGLHVIRRPDATETETNNRFICFADGSYLQICSFHDPLKSADHRWARMLAIGEGWVDYSLHSTDLAADAARLASAGIAFDGPKSSRKALLDGREWALGVLQAGRAIGASPALPFLVEDHADRAIRVPPPSAPQAGGATGIVGVTLLTADLAALAPALEALYGPGEPAPVRFDGGSAARLYQLAEAWVEVVEAAPGDTLVASHLASRGEGVFEVVLGRHPATRPGDATLLPIETTHGARLMLHAA